MVMSESIWVKLNENASYKHVGTFLISNRQSIQSQRWKRKCHRIMRKSVFEQEYYTFRNGVYNRIKLFRMTYKSIFPAEIIVTENVTMVIHHI